MTSARHHIPFISTLATALVCALGLTVQAKAEDAKDSGAQARPAAQVSASVRADATSTITYQGKLEQNGQPVDGTQNMGFALSTTADCSTLETGVLSRTVDFTNGVFAVDLGFSSGVFNGQALWLEIQVEGTDVACQPLRAAPYANTLRPRAFVEGDISAEEQLLDLRSGTSASADEGIVGAKVGHRTSLGYPVGVYGYAKEYGSVGLWGLSDSQFGWGVNGVALGTESIAVRGIAEALSTQTYGVYGEAASPDGLGGSFINTSTSQPGWALSVEGLNGAKIDGRGGSGLLATASGDSAVGDDAVRGVHSDGDGVVGESEGTANLDNGLIGFSAGGYGVYGFSNGTGQYGGYFDDPVFANGGCTGCTTRYVARNESDTTLRIGDAVRPAGVDTNASGAHQPVILAEPAARGDNVLGVVVGRTTMTVTDRNTDDARPGAQWGPTEEKAARPGEHMVITVQGMAQVRIAPDALVTAGDRIQLGERGATRASTDQPFAMALDDAASRTSDDLVWAIVGTP